MEATNSSTHCINDAVVYEALRSKNEKEINRAASCLHDHRRSFLNYIINRYGYGNSARDEMEKDLQDDFQDAVILFIAHVQQEPPRFVVKNVAFRSIKTYVFKCGEYIFLNRKNKINGQDRIHRQISRDRSHEAHVDGIAEMMKREQQRNVRKAILLLDDNCQRLLSQRFYDDLAPREIAAGSSDTANNISQQIIRCREKLRKTLIAEDLI